MSQLYQMQISFIPIQDRLLFRINTLDKTEHQFWLTRRYVKLLWTRLLDMLEEAHNIRHSDQQTKEAILSFQHETMVSKANFQTKYQQDVNSNNNEPILLSKLGWKKKPDGGQLLCLHPEKGQGVELLLDEMMLHSLCKLLSDSTQHTDWGLNLKITTSITKPTPQQVN